MVTSLGAVDDLVDELAPRAGRRSEFQQRSRWRKASIIVMSVLKTAALENRDSSFEMRESRPRQPFLANGDMGPVTNNGFLAVVAIIVAGSGAVFGILASASQQPILLTLMAVLAMFGVFSCCCGLPPAMYA